MPRVGTRKNESEGTIGCAIMRLSSAKHGSGRFKLPCASALRAADPPTSRAHGAVLPASECPRQSYTPFRPDRKLDCQVRHSCRRMATSNSGSKLPRAETTTISRSSTTTRHVLTSRAERIALGT